MSFFFRDRFRHRVAGTEQSALACSPSVHLFSHMALCSGLASSSWVLSGSLLWTWFPPRPGPAGFLQLCLGLRRRGGEEDRDQGRGVAWLQVSLCAQPLGIQSGRGVARRGGAEGPAWGLLLSEACAPLAPSSAGFWGCGGSACCFRNGSFPSPLSPVLSLFPTSFPSSSEVLCEEVIWLLGVGWSP